MAFASAHPHTMREPPQGDGLPAASHAFSSLLAGGATLAVAPVTLARAVVPRVVRALAARAQLSIGRISDALLLADALVLHTDDSLSSSHLNVELQIAPRELRLRVGPLHPGHASALAIHVRDAGTIANEGAVLRVFGPLIYRRQAQRRDMLDKIRCIDGKHRRRQKIDRLGA